MIGLLLNIRVEEEARAGAWHKIRTREVYSRIRRAREESRYSTSPFASCPHPASMSAPLLSNT